MPFLLPPELGQLGIASFVDVQAAADEWVRLRSSDAPDEQQAAAWAELPSEVWLAVLERHPDMAEWVAHAKRAPADIAARLAEHPDPRVRGNVAAQRRLDPAVRAVLAADSDEMVRRRAERFLTPDPE